MLRAFGIRFKSPVFFACFLQHFYVYLLFEGHDKETPFRIFTRFVEGYEGYLYPRRIFAEDVDFSEIPGGRTNENELIQATGSSNIIFENFTLKGTRQAD